MNRENIELNWTLISEKLQNRFPRLTSTDLAFTKGKEEELLCRIELRIDKSRFDVLRLIGTL